MKINFFLKKMEVMSFSNYKMFIFGQLHQISEENYRKMIRHCVNIKITHENKKRK